MPLANHLSGVPGDGSSRLTARRTTSSTNMISRTPPPILAASLVPVTRYRLSPGLPIRQNLSSPPRVGYR
jgi:hypothetical protein